ncbi:preprotein translocase subunit SecA [Planctomycetes bacterium Pla86]|uniref:Preprotein translocase subunit SecA n=1 Tax=Engelhardtia mirabilis TaxID=2528011 RepID=A0A518BMZ0_9BACT|nr:preprotein translocase subunit SecA [Planctomycetes bacterium Pla133]QDV02670.1 preprotein translocase subunit SecA [Planctomycetes bacterium Pla86]
MADRRITLETAAFLDSPQAAALRGISAADRRTVSERLLEAIHRDFGRDPAELDGEALRDLLGTVLPGRFAPRDPLAAHVPAVLEAYLAHLREVAVVTHAFELSMAVDPGLEAFAAAVASGAAPRRTTARESKPFEHGAAKTGRNDPCPCGSGKKFKQCHGKQG